MKKIKNLVYLFFALAMVSVLITSCERELIIEGELDGIKTSIIENEFNENTNLKILAEQVSESSEFKNIYKIDMDIFNKLETIILENDFTEKLVYDDFKAIFSQYENELVSNLERLSQKYPQLGNLEEDQLKEVHQAANFIIETSEDNLVSRANPCFATTGNCTQNCYDCYRYLNAQDYLAYRIRRDNCVLNGGSWNYCNTWSYNLYKAALPGNYDYYLSCFDDC